MSEVVARSVHIQHDGVWTVKVVVADDFRSYRVESEVVTDQKSSVQVLGPFKRLMEAVEEAERTYRGHTLLLV